MSSKKVILDIDFNIKQLNSITKAANEVKKLQQEVDGAKEGTLEYIEATRRLESAQNKLNTEQGKLSKSFKDTEKRASSFGKTIKGAAKSLAAFLAIGSGIQILKGAVNTLIDFEQSLASLSAITGATGGDLDFYAEQAREIGRTSTLSAGEAVEAFKLIGSAAPQLLQNSESLASVTREAVVLAEAAGITLPDAAATLGNALNAFNLPAEDASRIINTFAAASQQGAREIPFVTQAIEKFGGTAAAAGISVEESVAAIELLGKTSSDAAGIGTSLRNVILILRREAAKQGRDFQGLSAELELYGDKLDDVNFLTETFQQGNIQSAANLIAGRNELVNFTEAITGTETAYDQAKINTSTLKAEITKLGNAYTVAILSLRESTGGLTTAIRFLRENLGTIIRVVGALVAGFVGYRVAIVATNAAMAIGRATTIAYAFAKTALTSGLRSATVATRAFNTAAKANVFGLFASGIATAIALLADFSEKQVEVTENQKKFNDAIAAQNALLGRTDELELKLRLIPSLSQGELESLEGELQSQLSQLSDQRVIIEATISGRTENIQSQIATLERELNQIIDSGFDRAGRPLVRDDATIKQGLQNTLLIREEIDRLNTDLKSVEAGAFRKFGATAGATAEQIALLAPGLEQVRARLKQLDDQNKAGEGGVKSGTIAALEEQVKRLRKAIVEDLRIDSKDFQPTVKAYNAAVEELQAANARLSPEESPLEGSIDALSARASELAQRVKGLKIDSEEFANTVTDLIDAQLELQQAQALLQPVDRSAAREAEVAAREAEVAEEQRHQLALLGIIEATEEEKLALQLRFAQDRLTALQADNKSEIVELDKAANAIVELETQLAAVRSDIANKAADEARQRQQEELEGIALVLNQSFTSLNTLVGLQQQTNDQLLSLQQERVNQAVAIADQGNAALLKAEQDRLNELNKKREQFVRAQQVLAAAQLISESALAIARSAAEGGAAAPFTIAATLIALTAGLAQARALARASASGFKKGGYTGDGMASDEAGVVHKGEFVIDKPTTQALGLRNKSMIDFKREFAGRKELPRHYFAQRRDEGLSAKAVDQIVQAIDRKPVPSFTFNEDGIFTAAERTRKRKERVKKLAR